MGNKYFTGDNFEFKMVSDSDKGLEMAIEITSSSRLDDYHSYAEVEGSLIFFTSNPPYEYENAEKTKLHSKFNNSAAFNMVKGWLASRNYSEVEDEMEYCFDGLQHKGYTIWVDNLWGVIFKVKPSWIYYSK